MADVRPQNELTHAHRDGRRPTVMLLGSGEFSRELAIALQRLGAHVIAAERYADAPAHGVADQALVVNMTDADELGAAIRRLQPQFVVTASDVVATDALLAAAEAGTAATRPLTTKPAVTSKAAPIEARPARNLLIARNLHSLVRSKCRTG